MGKKIVCNWILFGREATSAVMFIPLIVLYMSATGAILFPFCKEFIKSCRNGTDNYPVPEWERPGGREGNRDPGALEHRTAQEVQVHTSRSHLSSWAGGCSIFPQENESSELLFHKLPGMHKPAYYMLWGLSKGVKRASCSLKKISKKVGKGNISCLKCNFHLFFSFYWVMSHFILHWQGLEGTLCLSQTLLVWDFWNSYAAQRGRSSVAEGDCLIPGVFPGCLGQWGKQGTAVAFPPFPGSPGHPPGRYLDLEMCCPGHGWVLGLAVAGLQLDSGILRVFSKLSDSVYGSVLK